uniref:Cation/H(+) antiporter C-terminal domain-containing protein n=1 Tax=Daucus carota subsp. sativus TaxID=79200 RepID=A0A166DC71_DAUCS
MDHSNSKGLWFGDNPLKFYVPSLLLHLSLSINILTKCFHFFLKPLGQPTIISQTLAGVVLGPSILGQSTTFLSNVFPKETRIVLETTASFGFMLFIFLIGVKVDPIMVYRTGKPLGTALAENLIALLKMPIRDALSLALVMNTKSIAELGFMIQMKHMNQLTAEPYTIMVISVVVITGVISPIVKFLYDPSRRYLAYRRRTILHLRRNEELRVLTCLHSPENVQASNPTKESPINLVVLHLVKLIGRASSLLVPYRQREKPSSKRSESEQIFSAFRKYEQLNYGSWIYGETVETSHAFRNLNKKVLDKAPCSVGVLLDRVKQKNPRYVLSEQLLQKGPDDREALSYGQRMSSNSTIELHLVRFITSNSQNIMGGKERSKMLDDNILSDFKHNTMSSKRVSYQEEVVSSGKDVVSSTRSVGVSHDLVLVGRRHGESLLMYQLKTWRDRGELGEVGETLAYPEYNCEASVLVMQHQTKLWGLHDPEESTHLRKCDF